MHLHGRKQNILHINVNKSKREREKLSLNEGDYGFVQAEVIMMGFIIFPRIIL